MRTGDYPDAMRVRLGEEVERARIAAGYSRATLAEKSGVSLRSVAYLEQADRSVSAKVLHPVARELPGWTEDTPRDILEGGEAPEPPTEPVVRLPTLRDDNERQLWALDLPEDVKWGYIYQYRARLDAARSAE